MRYLHNLHNRPRRQLTIPHWLLLMCLIGLLLLAITSCTQGCFFANANYSCPSILDAIPE